MLDPNSPSAEAAGARRSPVLVSRGGFSRGEPADHSPNARGKSSMEPRSLGLAASSAFEQEGSGDIGVMSRRDGSALGPQSIAHDRVNRIPSSQSARHEPSRPRELEGTAAGASLSLPRDSPAPEMEPGGLRPGQAGPRRGLARPGTRRLSEQGPHRAPLQLHNADVASGPAQPQASSRTLLGLASAQRAAQSQGREARGEPQGSVMQLWRRLDRAPSRTASQNMAALLAACQDELESVPSDPMGDGYSSDNNGGAQLAAEQGRLSTRARTSIVEIRGKAAGSLERSRSCLPAEGMLNAVLESRHQPAQATLQPLARGHHARSHSQSAAQPHAYAPARRESRLSSTTAVSLERRDTADRSHGAAALGERVMEWDIGAEDNALDGVQDAEAVAHALGWINQQKQRQGIRAMSPGSGYDARSGDAAGPKSSLQRSKSGVPSLSSYARDMDSAGAHQSRTDGCHSDESDIASSRGAAAKLLLQVEFGNEVEHRERAHQANEQQRKGEEGLFERRAILQASRTGTGAENAHSVGGAGARESEPPRSTPAHLALAAQRARMSQGAVDSGEHVHSKAPHGPQAPQGFGSPARPRLTLPLGRDDDGPPSCRLCGCPRPPPGKSGYWQWVEVPSPSASSRQDTPTMPAAAHLEPYAEDSLVRISSDKHLHSADYSPKELLTSRSDQGQGKFSRFQQSRRSSVADREAQYQGNYSPAEWCIPPGGRDHSTARSGRDAPARHWESHGNEHPTELRSSRIDQSPAGFERDLVGAGAQRNPMQHRRPVRWASMEMPKFSDAPVRQSVEQSEAQECRAPAEGQRPAREIRGHHMRHSSMFEGDVLPWHPEPGRPQVGPTKANHQRGPPPAQGVRASAAAAENRGSSEEQLRHGWHIRRCSSDMVAFDVAGGLALQGVVRRRSPPEKSALNEMQMGGMEQDCTVATEEFEGALEMEAMAHEHEASLDYGPHVQGPGTQGTRGPGLQREHSRASRGAAGDVQEYLSYPMSRTELARHAESSQDLQGGRQGRTPRRATTSELEGFEGESAAESVERSSGHRSRAVRSRPGQSPCTPLGAKFSPAGSPHGVHAHGQDLVPAREKTTPPLSNLSPSAQAQREGRTHAGGSFWSPLRSPSET